MHITTFVIPVSKNLVYPNLKLLNDTETIGIGHLKNMSFKQFFESLTSIRSNNNIIKDIKFIHIYTTIYRDYIPLINKYIEYTGSFLKWKFLDWIGIRRKNEDLI